jgi:hypothetical protein
VSPSGTCQVEPQSIPIHWPSAAGMLKRSICYSIMQLRFVNTLPRSCSKALSLMFRLRWNQRVIAWVPMKASSSASKVAFLPCLNNKLILYKSFSNLKT